MRALIVCVLVASRLLSPASAAEKWPALDPQEFAQTASKIDPEAGAEVIFRHVDLDQQSLPHYQNIYFRVRIYNQKGVEEYSKIEIPYSSEIEARNIEARVIFPNGTIRELNRKEIYDREILKVGKSRTRVKSFAPPGLEPGVVIDYRYSLIHDEPDWFSWFTYQSSVPTRYVSFRFRPVEAAGFSLRFLYTRSPQPSVEPDKKAFFEFEMRDLRAWKEEILTPPVVNLQPSVFIYYTYEKSEKPEVFWPKYAAKLAADGTALLKKNSALTATVGKLFPASTPPDQKLKILFDHVRTHVSNRARLTSTQRAELPVNRTPADTLKNGSGTPSDLNQLFFALASAAGLDARLVKCGDREDMLFNADLTEEFILSDDAVAVLLDGSWKYFQPGKPYLPFGVLDWRNTDTMLLVAAKKGAKLESVPGAAPNLSARNREGRFKLDSTGTLSGEVTITYTGLASVDLKEALEDLDPKQRDEYIRDQVTDLFKDADVSHITVEGATDHDGPVTVTYRLKVPEYAERTGTRLFLQPAVFQKNAPPLFPDKTRINDVVFRYRYTHRDHIEIEPPPGFSLEAPSAPAKLDVPHLCNYDVSLSIREKTRSVVYDRTFTLLRIDVPVTHYATLRGVFDLIRTRDQHALTFKRDPAPAPAPPPAPDAKTPAEAVTP